MYILIKWWTFHSGQLKVGSPCVEGGRKGGGRKEGREEGGREGVTSGLNANS